MEYFNGEVFPKFVFYSAHEETVSPLLIALGHSMVEAAPTASAIFVEFFTRAGEERVRTIFKPDPESEMSLMGGEMTLDEF